MSISMVAISCSSFVPIVETESLVGELFVLLDSGVAVRSFRLWKLKAFAVFLQRHFDAVLQFVRSDCGN